MNPHKCQHGFMKTMCRYGCAPDYSAIDAARNAYQIAAHMARGHAALCTTEAEKRACENIAALIENHARATT